MSSLCLIAFAAFAVADWVAVARAWRPLEYVCKPAALAFLLLFALQGPAPSGWLTAALVFSLLGDVYLMLPANLFAVGLAAFLLGHLAYIADFAATPQGRAGWFVLVAAVSAPLAVRIVRAVPPPPLRAAVGAYIAIIALMLASAIASGEPAAIVGALLFAASDAMIALNRFVAPIPAGRVAIVVTYHLGQLGLVLALR